MSSTRPTPQHDEAAPKVMGPPLFHPQTVTRNSYTHTLHPARVPTGLRPLAALYQPVEVPFVPTPIDQPPPFHHAPSVISHDAPSLDRKRKAPTLRAADWEPMKKRITELWTGNEKYTIPRLEKVLRHDFGFTATGRQISTQIKKWGLEKNAKPEESSFMVQKQKYRRLNEPGKSDLKFRVRGKEHSAEDLARWEARSVTHQQDQGKNAKKWGEITTALRRDPSQPPVTPAGVSYYTGSPASLAATPNRNMSPRLLFAADTAAHSPPSARASFAVPHSLTGDPSWTGNFARPAGTPAPNSNPGTPFPIGSTLHSPSPSIASTPRLVEDTGFEGNSPAPWNDAVQNALVMIGRHNPLLHPHSQANSEPPMIALKNRQDVLRNEIAVLEQLHGKTHPLTLEKTDRLLGLLIEGGNFKAAEELGRHTFLALRECGNTEVACKTLMKLSVIYSRQDNWNKAEKAATKAVEMATSSGPGVVLEAKFRLAEIKYNLFKYREAEDLVSQMLNVDKKQTIPQYTSLPGGPMALMAIICFSRGRFKEAEDWAGRTLKIIDVNSSATSSNCARILLEQWKLEQAGAIISQTLAMCLSKYGQESRETGAWLLHYGKLFTLQGAWEEAESCILASMSMLKKIVGPRSLSLQPSLGMLFQLYAEQSSWDKASAVLSEYKGVPELRIMEAEVFDALGRHNEAYDRARGALGDLEVRYPFDAHLKSVMVRILRNLGRVDESRELGTRILTIAEGMFGNSHPQTVQCKDNLARTYMAGGNTMAAIQAMTECVQLFTAHESVGPNHYLMQRSRDTLTEWLLFHGPADALTLA